MIESIEKLNYFIGEKKQNEFLLLRCIHRSDFMCKLIRFVDKVEKKNINKT